MEVHSFTGLFRDSVFIIITLISDVCRGRPKTTWALEIIGKISGGNRVLLGEILLEQLAFLEMWANLSNPPKRDNPESGPGSLSAASLLLLSPRSLSP